MRRRPSSLLFCPGDRAERFDKAVASQAPGVVLDLEDGVGPTDKSRARRNVFDWLALRAKIGEKQPDAKPAKQTLLALRVNALQSADGLEDLYAWAHAKGVPAQGWLVVPKVEDAGELAWLAAHVARRAGGWRVCALIESGRGLRELARIAAVPGLVALGFGGADLRADLSLGEGFKALGYARSRFVVEASGHDLHLMDVPHLVLNDLPGLHDECLRVRALGFGGKFAIHPNQVPVIAAAFAPTAAAIEAAQRIVAAFEAGHRQAMRIDGRMVDEPIYQQALATLAAAA